MIDIEVYKAMAEELCKLAGIGTPSANMPGFKSPKVPGLGQPKPSLLNPYKPPSQNPLSSAWKWS